MKKSPSPLPIVALLAIFVLIGLVYNVTIPLFEPPDEIWHFAFANHLASGQGLPHFSGEKPVFLREAGQPPLYYAIAALAVAPFDRGDFPGFMRFNASHPSITPGSTSDRPNVFIHTRLESWPYQGAVLAIHIARLVSLAFGLLTVLGVYAIARQVAPERPALATAAAGIAAFTPQFVLLSNSVNNDSLMAATATWTVWAGLKLLIVNCQLLIVNDPCSSEKVGERKKQGRWAVVLGVMLGLGLLSKLSAVALIPFVGLVFLVIWWHSPAHSTFHIIPRSPRPEGRGNLSRDVLRFTFYLALLTFSTAFLVAGWWYVRNIALYGDPLAWQVWLSDIGVRQPTPAVWQLVPEIPALFRTYWIEFTYGQAVPWLWVILSAITVIALGRCMSNGKSQIANRVPLRNGMSQIANHNFLLLLAWLGIIIAGVVRYMQTTPAAQGRLLFPAIAAISLLLAAGLSTKRTTWPAYGLVVGLCALSLAAPFTFVRPAFAYPLVSSLPADATPASTRFGESLELVGYRLTPQQLTPGAAIRVSTYWRAHALLNQDHRLLIRLLTTDGQSGGQAHFTLGSSLYPTTLWLPGQIVVDEHTVRADSTLPSGTEVSLQLGVGDEITPLLAVEGTNAWFSGDVAELAVLEVVTP
ncbi:MAG: glycosyltransferase family 39 protein [Thermoflexales bacterium]|nr:glycosyltransferase family 39 protein [Thermoflexales bacterium]